jgi:aldose 1-epimerase
MQHAFRGSRKLFAFLSACALISAAFAAGASAHAVSRSKGHHHHGNGGATITSQPWGTVPGEGPASLYTLTNSKGMSVNITNFGGVVQSIWVPDKRGGTKNVALGFATLSDYVNDFFQGHTGVPWPAPGGSGDAFFGAIIGRYANRIANASFMLNGQPYTLDANNGLNTLHGGFLGWNTAVWSAAPSQGPGSVSLELTNTFPAGEGCDRTNATTPCTGTGFPADVKATVVYTLTNDNQLKIDYNAVNESSTLATVINLTNHTYFNLGGEASGSVENQLLQINADQYTPVDANLIPESPFFVNVAGTAYDFRHLTPIGKNLRNTNLPDGFTAPAGQLKQLQIAHGYDNNWVLNGSGYRLVSTALDPKTGIVLKTFTDQPGVQFYSSNFQVGDLIGTSGSVYRQTQGFTLETQHYPDSPHHIGDPAWPSVVLNAGGTFKSTTSYAFDVAGKGDHGHGHNRR